SMTKEKIIYYLEEKAGDRYIIDALYVIFLVLIPPSLWAGWLFSFDVFGLLLIGQFHVFGFLLLVPPDKKPQKLLRRYFNFCLWVVGSFTFVAGFMFLYLPFQLADSFRLMAKSVSLGLGVLISLSFVTDITTQVMRKDRRTQKWAMIPRGKGQSGWNYRLLDRYYNLVFLSENAPFYRIFVLAFYHIISSVYMIKLLDMIFERPRIMDYILVIPWFLGFFLSYRLFIAARPPWRWTEVISVGITFALFVFLVVAT
ncbi:MAG: hypothetical protein AAFU64_12140, partial [Bacteroidota bacterium]